MPRQICKIEGTGINDKTLLQIDAATPTPYNKHGVAVLRMEDHWAVIYMSLNLRQLQELSFDLIEYLNAFKENKAKERKTVTRKVMAK